MSVSTPTPGPDKPVDTSTPARVYPRLELWVNNWLAPTLSRRESSHLKWCRQWWEHPEVVVRLDSLWRGWEAARRDDNPTAMSGWWVYHLDAHLRQITAADGPLHKCTGREHYASPPLPVHPCPPGHLDEGGAADRPASSAA